jgi:hypothetical protein
LNVGFIGELLFCINFLIFAELNLRQIFGSGALPGWLRMTMGINNAGTVVVGWLLISGTTNRAEKLQVILLIIFLNDVC